MKIYIAGPMRGYPLRNFPAFDEAQKRLEEAGHTVFSPAQYDRDIGYDFSDPTTSVEGFPMIDAILWDLETIARDCDAIYVLPGWGKSKGAAVEIALAQFLNKIIYYSTENLFRDVWMLYDLES